MTEVVTIGCEGGGVMTMIVGLSLTLAAMAYMLTVAWIAMLCSDIANTHVPAKRARYMTELRSIWRWFAIAPIAIPIVFVIRVCRTLRSAKGVDDRVTRD